MEVKNVIVFKISQKLDCKIKNPVCRTFIYYTVLLRFVNSPSTN